MLQTLKLNNKKTEKNPHFTEKKFGRIDSGLYFGSRVELYQGSPSSWVAKIKGKG
jgi:hypothetical protein